MVDPRKITPDFFDDGVLDPVEAATGPSSATKSHGSPKRQVRTASSAAKKKAGFYLSEDILNRFNLKFYELKLAGASIENKSYLLELMLGFALDDMDKGEKSRILQSSNSS
jgi:hypothetical protein